MAENFSINPVIVTPEIVDDFRRNFANPAEAFAMDLVTTFQGDYREKIEEDPNFLTYEGLRSGTAGIFNEIPQFKDLQPRERSLSNDEITYLFSNAEPASFARPFFSELVKAVPSTYAMAQTARAVGPRIIPTTTRAGMALGTPFGPYGQAVGGGLGFGTGVLTTGAISLFGGGIPYVAVDAIEESVFGPDPVVTPGQRATYETYRTLGGAAGSIYMPWLVPTTVNIGGRAMLANIAKDAPEAIGGRLVTGLENILGTTGQMARRAPALTAMGETVGGAGAGAGAYLAESIDPGGTGARLFGELVGGNTLAATAVRILPTLLPRIKTETTTNPKLVRMFEKINEIYADFASPEDADLVMQRLTDPDFVNELKELFPDVNFTVAQQTGDPVLMSIESVKAGVEPQLNAARKRAERQAYETFNTIIQGLISTGDQEAINTAAILRQSVYNDIIRTGLQRRIDSVMTAAEKLNAQPGQAGYRTQEQLSEELYDVIEQYLDFTRRQESQLWQNVDNVKFQEPFSSQQIQNEDFQPPSFLAKYEELYGGIKNRGLRIAFRQAFPEIVTTLDDMKASLNIPTFGYTAEQSEQLSRATEAFVNSRSNVSGEWRGKQDTNHYGSYALEQIENQVNALDNIDAQIELVDNYIAMMRSYETGGLRDPIEDPNFGPYIDLGSNVRNGRIRVGPEQKRVLAALNDYSSLLNTQKQIDIEATPTAQDFEGLGIDLNQVIELRGRLGERARQAAAAGDNNYARILSELSSAILDDINATPAFSEAYDVARNYSKSRNDVFTRTITGRVGQTTGTGATRETPEALFHQYVKTNPSITLNRVRSLENLAKFVDQTSLQGGMTEADFDSAPIRQPFTTVTNLVESYLRGLKQFAGREVFDPATGQTRIEIDANKLNTWKENNQDLLELFPALNVDLADAVSAQRALQIAEANAASAQEVANRQTYLSQLIEGVNPIVAVGEAFESNNPNRAFTNLFSLQRMGRQGPLNRRQLRIDRAQEINESPLTVDEVNEGFRSAILEWAYLKAGGEGAFNPRAFQEVLFGGLPNDPRSRLATLAEQNGIFDEAFTNRVRAITEQLVRVQDAMAAGRSVPDPTIQDANIASEGFIRATGAGLGTTVFRNMPILGNANSLIAGSIGSQVLRKYFSELPFVANMRALDLIFTDPQLAAMYFRRPQDAEGVEKQGFDIANRINQKLFGVALTQQPFVTRELFEEEDRGTQAPYPGFPGLPEDVEATREQLRQRMIERDILLRNQPSANIPTAGGPTVPSPFTMAPAGQQVPSISSSGPVDRARFAAFFPEDRELMGIGSLMG